MNKEQMLKMACDVYKTVPLYHNLAVSCGIDINKLNEFEDFPIVSKNHMLDGEGECIAPQYITDYLNGKLLKNRTSGSTGKYLEILWDETDCKKSLLELWIKRVKYYNVYPHNRLMYFFTGSSQDELFINRKYEFGICKKLLTDKGVDSVYESILEWNPEWMMLQPSSAVILCNYVKSNNVPKPEALRYIEFSGELLTDDVRKMTKETFGCAIANQYGANEVNSIAYECPYGKMHIMQSNVYVEIVDNDGNIIKNSGQNGRIVLTSLTNKAMPFIRYDIGDIGCMNKAPCQCGNNKPFINLTSGRANDYIEFSNGERTGSYLFVKILDSVNMLTGGAIRQFYIEQRDYDCFNIKICRDEEMEPEFIKEKFFESIGEPRLRNAEYKFEFTDELFEALGNGKYIYFKNMRRSL